MLSSSESDSEDDKVMKLELEAAIDGKLLCDSMFTVNPSKDSSFQRSLEKDDLPANLPSQRYLGEDELETSSTWFWQDAIVPVTSQEFLAKKFGNLLNQLYEYSDTCQELKEENLEKTEHLKLLSDANCYLKDEMDDGYHPDTAKINNVPRKKWQWKQRTPRGDEMEGGENGDRMNPEILKNLVINGSDILNGHETKHWTPKPNDKKVFYYKFDKNNGICNEIPTKNEFSDLRIRNNWDESKIRHFRRRKN